jgi:radical SAM protein with 4Fe4S-binding SPASM domain
MELEAFDAFLHDAKQYTSLIACHVFGDPLTVSNLSDYLDLIEKHAMKAELTTSGYFLNKHSESTLFHKAVKQINISLNSFNKNESALSFDQYVKPILTLCKRKNSVNSSIFINLRLWNLDNEISEAFYNRDVFSLLENTFMVDLRSEAIYKEKPKSIRLDEKILLHFDHYFEWPSLENQNYGDGTCQGLQSHIAVLADGTVVPCCLDGNGIIALGNIHKQNISEILDTQRAKAMLLGFKKNIATEELCQKCSYKERFSLS